MTNYVYQNQGISDYFFLKKKRSSHGHSLDVACKKPSIETSNELGIDRVQCCTTTSIIIIIIIIGVSNHVICFGSWFGK